MKELKKLVQIVTNRGKKSLPILDLKTEPGEENKELQLFHVIQNLDPATDSGAAKAMYNSTVDDPRYKMLKHRLKNRLLNHLFFIDFKDSKINVSHQFEQECHNYLYFSRTLLKQGDKSLSEKLANKALTLAKEAEFTPLVIQSLEIFRQLYSEKCMLNQFNQVVAEIKEYKKLLELEEEANTLFFGLRLKLKKSVNSRKKNLPATKRAIAKLKELHEQTGSFNIFERHYRLSIWYHELNGNFGEILKISDEINQRYEKDEINLMRFDLRYNKYSKIYAHLRLKDYENGLKYAAEYVDDFDPTSSNYFAFMENYFMLAMHSGDYPMAYDLLKKTTKSQYFHKVDRFAEERWNLYKAYMYFIKPDKRLKKTFDFNGFYNSVPEYSKDKKGFNIAILILQFLHHLKNNNEEALYPLIERFRKYAALHLYHPSSQRSRIFLKLLIIASEKNLNPEICREKSENSYNKLKNISPPGDAFAEIEIIPFETMWELILEMMEKKQQYA